MVQIPLFCLLMRWSAVVPLRVHAARPDGALAVKLRGVVSGFPPAQPLAPRRGPLKRRGSHGGTEARRHGGTEARRHGE
jgi:hypothetical protein